MEPSLQLLWVLGLVLIAMALLRWQRLELAWPLALATGRMLLQLAVLGYVLAAVYELGWPWALGFVGLMVAGGAWVTRNRISQTVPRLGLWVGGSLLLGLGLSLAYGTLLVFQPATIAPAYLIPLAGVLLGNAMNGAAIAGERLVNTLNASPIEIETHLSLGATPQQAIARYRQDAIKAGVLPTINTLTVTGLVTLPSFMSGQLFSGTPPLLAAAYQAVILILVVFATLIAVLVLTAGICRHYFNAAGQLQRW
jgi:putative ABC transport system permease protein